MFLRKKRRLVFSLPLVVGNLLLMVLRIASTDLIRRFTMGLLSFERLRFRLFDDRRYSLTLTRDSRITIMLSTLVDRCNLTLDVTSVGLEDCILEESFPCSHDGTKSVLQL